MGTPRVSLKDVRQGKPKSQLRLLAPLRYLLIWHPQKVAYDFYLPLGITLIVWIIQQLLFPRIPVFGDNGLLKYTRDVIAIAVPFLVGALATVAMSGPTTTLDRRPEGVELYLDSQLLTLRQFVCYLLGYLSFLGLFLLIASIMAALIRDTIISWYSSFPMVLTVLKPIGMLVITGLIVFFLVTILWALFFLTDIVNRTPTYIPEED